MQEIKRLSLTQQITEECLVCLEGTEDWEPLAQAIKKFNDHTSFLLKKKKNLLKKKKRNEHWRGSSQARTIGGLEGVAEVLGAIIGFTVIVGGGVWLLFFAPDALKYSLLIIGAIICIGVAGKVKLGGWLIIIGVAIFVLIEFVSKDEFISYPCVVCESDRGYYGDGGFLEQRVIRCKTCDAVK